MNLLNSICQVKGSYAKIIALFIFLAATSFSFAQVSLKKPAPIKKHTSVFIYNFDEASIQVTNEYAKEPAVKLTPAYIQYPYSPRKLIVYGPTVGLAITPHEYTIHSLDISPNGVISMSDYSTPYVMDTTGLNKKRFDISNLQVRIVKNNKVVSDWKKIKPETQITKGTFVVYNDALEVNDHAVITFKNKNDTSLLQFEFERAGSPLMPFLAKYTADTSSLSYIGFIEKEISKKEKESASVNEFYQYWPNSRNNLLNNDRQPVNSKLSLMFRKPDPSYPDTTMEYVLSTGLIKDTVWHTTGHLLFIPALAPGTNYVLLVRYKTVPGNIKQYRFYTLPEWYQTRVFKYAIGTGITMVVLGLLVFLYRFRLKREKLRHMRLQNELRSIRSQLNPHFVFNALSSIQGLINKNDIPAANHYLSEFSSLLRQSLNEDDKEMVPLATEFVMLDAYLKLEQLRFGFQYTIITDEKIDRNTIDFPSLLIQPLVENAIKHGIAGIGDKGSLSILFQAENATLKISIADNGSGFDSKKTTSGFGLKLTRDRIQLLNQTLKNQQIKIIFESIPNNGTTVHLSFENWL